MKIPPNTTGIQSTPFLIFRMITECVAGRCMVGSVVHSVPTMYKYASCLWIIHTAVAIRWPGTASGRIFGTPLFSHCKKLKGKLLYQLQKNPQVVCSKNFYTGRLCFEVIPLNLLYTNLNIKGAPIVYLTFYPF